MKLVTFATGDAQAAGVVINDRVYALADLGLPNSIVELLKSDGGLEQLKAAEPVGDGLALADVKLLAVLPQPTEIFLLAGNYQSHLTEGGGSAVEKDKITPRVFIKPHTSVIGNGDFIDIPTVSTTVDYELEFAAVIGKSCKNVSEAEAEANIAGYVVFNDVSARRLTTVAHRSARDGDSFFDWLIGKWCDSFAAIGPYLVTADEIGDPTSLQMSLSINGVVRQHSDNGDILFSAPEAIAYLSQFVTIEAGSIICMGTPGGVGDTTQTYLQPGDVVVAEIEKLGRLENIVR